MPEVLIFRNQKIVSDKVMEAIIEKSCPVIASVLDIPRNKDARVFPEDINITVFDRSKFDKGIGSLRVLIFANDYPERREDIDGRMEKIAECIREIWSRAKGKGFVWTLPMGGFAKL